ncbi:hypothetical protein BH23GEM9_BH23GEM9_12890 [soil metagenome]
MAHDTDTRSVDVHTGPQEFQRGVHVLGALLEALPVPAPGGSADAALVQVEHDDPIRGEMFCHAGQEVRAACAGQQHRGRMRTFAGRRVKRARQHRAPHRDLHRLSGAGRRWRYCVILRRGSRTAQQQRHEKGCVYHSIDHDYLPDGSR